MRPGKGAGSVLRCNSQCAADVQNAAEEGMLRREAGICLQGLLHTLRLDLFEHFHALGAIRAVETERGGAGGRGADGPATIWLYTYGSVWCSCWSVMYAGQVRR